MTPPKPGQAEPFHWHGTMAEFDAEVRRRWIEASDERGLDHGMPNAAAALTAQRAINAAPGGEVRTCYCGTTATVVPGVFPHDDCDGSVPAAAVKPTPGRAVYEAWHAAQRRRFPGIMPIAWDELSDEAQAEWEGIARAGIDAGGWDALAADIESLSPGDGVSVGSTILAQVCRAVTARLTGSKPEGEVSVWIDDDGDGDAKVTVAWGSPREAEKAARGEGTGGHRCQG